MNKKEYAKLINYAVKGKKNVKKIVVSCDIWGELIDDLKAQLMPFFSSRDVEKMQWDGVPVKTDGRLKDKSVKVVCETPEMKKSKLDRFKHIVLAQQFLKFSIPFLQYCKLFDIVEAEEIQELKTYCYAEIKKEFDRMGGIVQLLDIKAELLEK